MNHSLIKSVSPAIIPLVIALWLFIPDGIIGHPMSDMPDHFWGNRWFAEKIWNLEIPIYTSQTHYPEGGYLWHIDPIGGIIQLFTLPLAPHHAWHFGLFIQLSAAGLLMAALSKRYIKDQWISIGLGLALIFSAHVLGLLHSGLSEYLGIGWLIGIMWTLKVKPDWKVGLLLGLSFWQAAPYGLLGAILCLGTLWKKPKLLGTIAITSLAVASPALYAIQWIAQHPDAAFDMSQSAGWAPQSLPSIDIMGWVMVGSWVHPDTPALGNPGILQAHSLSLTLVGVLIYGVLKNSKTRQWLTSYWGIVLLMLGPKLSINRWMAFGGLFFLPMALLYLPGLPTRAFHHPYHVAALVLPILLIGAGYALKNTSRSIQLALLALYLVESAYSPAGLMPARTAIPNPVKTNGPRLDWPPDRHVPSRQYLLEHVYHKQETYTGVSRWLGPCLLNRI